MALADNNILLVHGYIRLTGYVGRAILLRHPLVRYIPNNGLLMRKPVPAESGDNKRIRGERHPLHPTITNDITDRRALREQTGQPNRCYAPSRYRTPPPGSPVSYPQRGSLRLRDQQDESDNPLFFVLPPIDIRSTFRESSNPIQSADSRENCP